MDVDLLKWVEYGGCSAKMSAELLQQALKDLPKIQDERLLVDIDTHDDAGVYQLDETTALIQTTDFFPPICSDPFTFGQIAAANALSDVYAMGGRPLTALNLMMYPADAPMNGLRDILHGGQEKVTEAGALIVGGHTLDDAVPKYGLAVTGVVDPKRVITNAGAQPGDVLVLTKPLGTGVMQAGQRVEAVSDEDYRAALQWMAALNADACAAMQEFGAHAATDITGFGLVGHGLKLAQASRVHLEIETRKLPVLDGVIDLLNLGCVPGAAFRNQKFVGDDLDVGSDVSYEFKMLACDAQTSGGLLICVPEEGAQRLVARLRDTGNRAARVIGRVGARQKKAVALK